MPNYNMKLKDLSILHPEYQELTGLEALMDSEIFEKISQDFSRFLQIPSNVSFPQN